MIKQAVSIFVTSLHNTVHCVMPKISGFSQADNHAKCWLTPAGAGVDYSKELKELTNK